MSIIEFEKYQHYRTGKVYQILGFGRHSETCEEVVIYQGLYMCEKFGKNPIWVRPKSMFFEKVEFNGQLVPRFLRVNG